MVMQYGTHTRRKTYLPLIMYRNALRIWYRVDLSHLPYEERLRKRLPTLHYRRIGGGRHDRLQTTKPEVLL